MQNPHTIDPDEIRRIGPPLQKNASGAQLWDWVQEHYPFFSPLAWRQEIESGHITINNLVTKDPCAVLSQGDHIGRIHPLDEEPDVNTNIDILWQDQNLAVISKPAGLPMHEAAFFRRKTVHWLLPRLLGGDWHAVHRLDRETSGILVCAKGATLRKKLAKSLQAGEFKKTYLALCRGIPAEIYWIDERPILPGRSPRDRARCAESNEPSALAAETEFELLDHRSGLSLIKAQPRTGRTHQIRVHLASSGLPIVGDKVYHRDENVFQQYLRDGNTEAVQKLAGHPHHLLHAWKIEFDHPLTGERVCVEAPPPPAFRCLSLS